MNLEYVVKKQSENMSLSMRERNRGTRDREISLNLKAIGVVTIGRTSGRSGGIFRSSETPN